MDPLWIGSYPFKPIIEVFTHNHWFEIGYFNTPKAKEFYFNDQLSQSGEYLSRMSQVIDAINPILYVWVMDCALDGEETLGENGTSIGFLKSKNETYFTFSYEYNVFTEITYPEGIQLFYAYFTAYKKFIQTQAPEMKNEMYSMELSNEAIDEPWYPDFCDRLEKLKSLYNDMVASGEIDPSNIRYPKNS